MSSLLQQMTQGITAESVMERKAERATKLTPVKGESATSVAAIAAGVPDVPGSFLTNEGIAMTAGDLRVHAANLIAIADALDVLTGMPSNGREAYTGVAKRNDLETKAIEKAADEAAAKRAEPTEQEAFDAALAAKAVAAQAAAFASADADTDEEPEAPEAPASGGDWACPKHGTANIRVVTSRTRTYRACESCDEFEPK
jgi:hypothetical protein